jgi:uncharacterized membrane-anchored protein
MNGKNWLIISFVAVIVGQLVIPGWMIAQHESILRTGTAYKFRCEPVDPYDAFRGRYVSLSPLPNEVAATESPTNTYPAELFGLLGIDSEGFATITSLSKTEPTQGDHIRLQGVYFYEGIAKFRLPFDRYYMDESKAPAAEIAYRDFSNKRNSKAYVVVRVKNGQGLIEELFVDDEPILEFLRNAATK